MIPVRPSYKFGIIGYLLAWFVGSFWFGGLLKSGTVTSVLGVHMAGLEHYAYYALAGAIGGTLYALRLLHEYYDQLTERWLVWYLLRPIKCAGASVMTIVLFQSGIMLLQTGNSVYAKIGIAFLVGFGYGKLMDKLKSLTEALFNGSKEQTPDNKPPQ
ncbi:MULTISPECIES: hypothetical protein [unclassified Paenibacillus]|uniref:hypothetical protein n=1 Tax=unclassified Paenibacillus TaxID=185978 RepID=UPI0006D2A43C|nr:MULTISPECIES: hypothetical protein [unclassified Paenibacillus]